MVKMDKNKQCFYLKLSTIKYLSAVEHLNSENISEVTEERKNIIDVYQTIGETANHKTKKDERGEQDERIKDGDHRKST